MPNTIPDTDEAWETGELGTDAEFARPLPDEDASKDVAQINESLGLQPISIRLEKSLVDDFKTIATINGLGYQTLMRQALKRFASCEMKRILGELAAETKKRRASIDVTEQVQHDDPPKRPARKAA